MTAAAELAQVQQKIAETLAARATVRGQPAWRKINQDLHELHMREYDLKRGVAA